MQASADRSLVFAGKENLKILELQDSKGTLLNRGKNVGSFVDIKLIQSGQLLVHEDATLDLVFYDSDFREIKRLPRAASGHNPFSQSRRTIQHGSAKSVYGWFAGNEELRIVNLANGEFASVPNFFGMAGQKATPIAIALAEKERKAAGLYTVPNSSDVFLAVLSPNGAVSRVQVDTLVKQQSRPPSPDFSASCLETSLDESLLFVGGACQTERGKTAAKLFALTFESVPRVVDEIDLSTGGPLVGAVHCAKRFLGKNVLLLGAHKVAVVVEWTGSHLCVLNVVDDAHSSSRR